MTKLSCDQLRAVVSEASHLCILACAGSGKTTALTHRLARLIASEQAQPRNIAAITFTQLAAEELLLRLATLVPDRKALSEMFVGTIHAFCLHLLQDFTTGRVQGLRVLSENQQFALLNLHWDQWGIQTIQPELARSQLLARLVTTLDIARMEQIHQGAIADRHPELAAVVSSYCAYLEANDYVDFAGILVRVSGLLESDPDFLASVRGRYQWLFVDEYQDVDPLQEHIIQRISRGQRLCVVGDDDQAIYQFRGTTVENLLAFAARYPQSSTEVLTENRRCRSNISAVAECIVMQNQNRAPKEIHPTKPGGEVQFLSFANVMDEAGYVCAEIMRLHDTGQVSSYSDFAVLLRSVASYGDVYLTALADAGIPYVSKGARSMFRQLEVVQLTACLEFIAKPDDSAAHLQLLDSVVGEVPAELLSDDMSIAVVDQNHWRERGLLDSDYQVLEALLDIRERYRRRRFESLLDLVYDVIRTLGLLNPGHREGIYYNVGMFTRLVSEFEEIDTSRKLHRLCAHLAAFASKHTDEATPVQAAGDAVRVLTVHQSKGLEFQVVFCPMLVNRRFPSTASTKRWLLDDDLFDSARYRNSIEDERRLFYVAATRAKSHLYLTCSRDVGLRQPVEPSEFFILASRAEQTQDHSVDTPEARPDNATDSLSTSYSAMEYYLTCPYRYQLLQIYGFTTPANPFFEFGRVIHTVVGLLHLQYQAGEQINDAEIERVYEANFSMRYRVPAYVLATRKRAGLSALKRYWTAHRDWFDAAATVEQPFAYYTSGALIQGRIDLLLSNAHGYEIVDIKTGKPHEGLHRDFQMSTYSLAAREQLGLEVNRATLLYIEANETHILDVTPAFLETGRRELAVVLSGISGRRFAATPGPACTRCEFRQSCPYRDTRKA